LADGSLEDDGDLEWKLNRGGSRFGIDFKDGDLSARIEIRTDTDSVLRVWRATWNFGAGKFLIGHDYAPASKSVGLSARGGTGSHGDMGATWRKALLQWSFPLGPGTLEIAGIEPNVPDDPEIIANGDDIDVTFPKLEASYDVKFGPTHWYPYIGWQTYDEVDTSNREESITSWTVALYGSWGLGAFTINGGAYYAINGDQYGIGADAYGARWNTTTDGIDDSKTYGLNISAVWVINDVFRLQGGYHYLNSEPDTDGSSEEQTKSMYYLNAPIYVTKNMTITPGIGKKDAGTTTAADGTETDTRGSTTYFGARWVVTF
jgi:hypothetical protein